MTKKLFEDLLLECQKEADDVPELAQYIEAMRELIQKVYESNFQDRSRDLLIYAIITIKLDALIKQGKWFCGTSERVWRSRAEDKMRGLFCSNENELDDLINAFLKNEELSVRQKAIIRLAWKKIGWPVYRGSNRLKEYLSD